MMKKICYLISLCALVFSCTNKEFDFPDYEYQSVYFPFQFPIRTLLLGDEVLGDNTIDKERAFSIAVATGGVYRNEAIQKIIVEIVPELLDSVRVDSVELKILPSNYYSIDSKEIEIPVGSFIGKMRVNLTDEFFADSTTVGLNYVLPVRIVDATTDTILRGAPAVGFDSPDPRVAEQWDVLPKDYTLFAVKYINAIHGVYLFRGQRIDITATPNDTIKYSYRSVIDNPTTKLTTKSLTQSYMTTLGGVKTGGEYAMILEFDENDQTIVIKQKDTSSVVVSGTGHFYTKDDDQCEGYNMNKHRTIYLEYEFVDGGSTYQVNDSLVFVDTDVKFEDFEISLE